MDRSVEIIASILLGVGLSLLFKLSCDYRGVLVYRAPLLEEKIIHYDNKCYTPTEHSVKCDKNKMIVDSNE